MKLFDFLEISGPAGYCGSCEVNVDTTAHSLSVALFSLLLVLPRTKYGSAGFGGAATG